MFQSRTPSVCSATERQTKTCSRGPWVSLADSLHPRLGSGQAVGLRNDLGCRSFFRRTLTKAASHLNNLYHACVTQPDRSRAVEVFLESRDEACTNCGYNLRGLKATECPKCGAPVRFEIPRPRRVLWHSVVCVMCGIAFGNSALTLAFEMYSDHRTIVLLPGSVSATASNYWNPWPDLIAIAGACGVFFFWIWGWKGLCFKKRSVRWSCSIILLILLSVHLGYAVVPWV